MASEFVIYTDGHGIKITPYQLIVGKAAYLLEGITNVRFYTIRANTAPPLILVLIGLIAVVMGTLHLISTATFPPVHVLGAMLSPNNILAMAGCVLIFFGIIWAIGLSKKYAVNITTAEGMKDVVVSRKKDYIDQVFSALREALMRRG